MKIINASTIIELTTDELENFRDFFDLLDSNENLTLQGVWDVMEAIKNEDNDILNDYGYILNIKN